MRRAVCSGSFDPVTLGHVDIFERGSRLFDELIICVFHNVKKQSFLPVQERVRLLKEAVSHLPNVSVASFSGLLADFMAARGLNTVLRGVRTAADWEYESHGAWVNKHVGGIETVFLPADPRYAHLSSSAIRELAVFGGSISDLVPECVESALNKKKR